VSEAIAVVVVAHNSADHLGVLARAVLGQLSDSDEFIIVDNASSDGSAQVAGDIDPRVTVMETGANAGFAAACHHGARASRASLLLFLNPDCEIQPGCLATLREAASEHPEWASWQAVVLLPDGRINSSGGVVHYLGMGWARDCDCSIERLASASYETAVASGAALVVRRGDWDRLGGLDPTYFLYGEDLDLGLRLWLSGRPVGVVPDARVVHAYEFDKGEDKWFFLERNRWRTVLSVYPLRLLVLLAPVLLACEIALLVIAARQGWLRSKLRAQRAVLTGLPETLRRRRLVQAHRQIGPAEFAEHLEASLDSPYLHDVDSLPVVGRAQARMWSVVRALL
jgi:N-acetylglucosaminyl-diphospho-decaprenol L-rhamnosyltransferase